jgi:hypothetical protein
VSPLEVRMSIRAVVELITLSISSPFSVFHT